MESDSRDVAALGQAIIRRREALNWTTHRLAQRAGVPDPFLRRIEEGKPRTLGVGTIARLARALGTTTDALLIESGLMEPPADWQAGRQPLDVYLRETSSLRDDDIHAVAHLVRRLSESAERYEMDESLDMGRGYNAASTDQAAIDEHQQGGEDERGEASPD